ncbi:hypothetical protein AGMMS49975_29520 [Clostridia bacterium]|nr:hypothetical protein AGMMS49975_29520 [Clostridia bacterium]
MFADNVKNILRDRRLLDSEDYIPIEELWGKLTSLLSENVRQTIDFLDNCSSDEAEWISEVFEDIAYNLQSWDYIDCLKRLLKKYPDANLDSSVQVAENYMQ